MASNDYYQGQQGNPSQPGYNAPPPSGYGASYGHPSAYDHAQPNTGYQAPYQQHDHYAQGPPTYGQPPPMYDHSGLQAPGYSGHAPSPQPYGQPASTYQQPAAPYSPPASLYNQHPDQYQHAPQPAYDGGPSVSDPSQNYGDPSQPKGDRGFKTNAAIAGGVALAGGAMLYHHHQCSSPGPNNYQPPAPASGSFFHHQNSGSGHPLAAIADPQKASIIFTIADGGEEPDKDLQFDNIFLRKDLNAGPAYKIKYTDSGAAGEVSRGPALPNGPRKIGSWKSKSYSSKLKFEFPESKRRHDKDARKWDYRVDDQRWSSDIGALNDHELEWNMMNESRRSGEVRFTLRCIDEMDDDRPSVCQVTMQTYNEGKIEVPLTAVRDDEELDEMMVVALSAMDWWRDSLQG